MPSRSLLALLVIATSLTAADRPNILLITAEDMDLSAVGAYGCPVPETTPTIDALASAGTRFASTTVPTSVCQPSKMALMSSWYPHRSGATGWFHATVEGAPCLPALLKAEGYYTAGLTKAVSGLPYDTPEAWDLIGERTMRKGKALKRSAEWYLDYVTRAFDGAAEAGKPSFVWCNIADPHRPFYLPGDPEGEIGDAPSRIYQPEEITVPGYLPDLPDIRREVAAFYSVVRRHDDIIKAVLAELDRRELREDTVVIYLSDHGTSLPRSKGNCYPWSNLVPLIISWPGGGIPSGATIASATSTMDLMPTILSLTGTAIPQGLNGEDRLPLLRGEVADDRGDEQFVQFHINKTYRPTPMRTVFDAEWCYIWNPWADGAVTYKMENMIGLSFDAMAASDDPAVQAMVAHYLHRSYEELYDLRSDPHCLTNLAADPAHADDLAAMRARLLARMTEADDPLTDFARSPDDPAACAAAFARTIELTPPKPAPKKKAKSKDTAKAK